MPSLTETVRRTIARHNMTSPGRKVLAAVSGGPDSMAMLHALAELAPELGVSLAAAHLDHGIREGSRDDAVFVARAAERMGIQCIVECAGLGDALRKKPENVQAAARKARYAFLERAAAMLSADRIAVGHTADDQAETWLMRELRGSGACGLSGIPPVNGMVIRPLIEASRDEVEAYLAYAGIEALADPTNLKPVYLRNRLRLTVMPLLREQNPNLANTLSRSADVMREEDGFLHGYIEGLLPSLMEDGPPGVLSARRAAFEALHPAIQRRVIRRLVEAVKGDLLGVGYGHVMDAVELALTGGTGKGIDLPGGVRVENSYTSILVYKGFPRAAGFSAQLPLPGSVEIPGAGIRVEALAATEWRRPPDGRTAYFDPELLKGPLVVRSRRPGDFFYPAGMDGRKKLKDYFMDIRLPRMERERVGVLECRGGIAWVMGIRPDRRFAAGPGGAGAVKVSFRDI